MGDMDRHGATLTRALSRKREREQLRAPSPLYSGERVGVRGSRAAQLNMVANQVAA